MITLDRTTKEERRCENCRFFRPIEEHGQGQCVAKAPLPFIGGVILRDDLSRFPSEYPLAAWPLVYITDYCGEHLPAEGKLDG